jgi:hypothetical protein
MWKNPYGDIRTMEQGEEEDKHGIHEDDWGGCGSYACKCMDLKQLWGEECQVVVVSLPRSIVSPSGECIWPTHASAWLVVKCKVEVR